MDLERVSFTLTCDRKLLMGDCVLSTRSRVLYDHVAGCDMWTARCKLGYSEQEDVGLCYFANRAEITLSSSPWIVRQTDTCLAGVLVSTEGGMFPCITDCADKKRTRFCTWMQHHTTFQPTRSQFCPSWRLGLNRPWPGQSGSWTGHTPVQLP